MIHAHAEAEKSIKSAVEENKNRRLAVLGQIGEEKQEVSHLEWQ